jgi:hypothetical protein
LSPERISQVNLPPAEAMQAGPLANEKMTFYAEKKTNDSEFSNAPSE